MTKHESDLSHLIEYWQANYTLNYLSRTPQTNQRILDTIKYLQQLKKMLLPTRGH